MYSYFLPNVNAVLLKYACLYYFFTLKSVAFSLTCCFVAHLKSFLLCCFVFMSVSGWDLLGAVFLKVEAAQQQG